MSILATARRTAKHRGKTPTQLKTELAQLEGEANNLACVIVKTDRALRHTARELGTAVVETQEAEERAAGLASDNDALQQRVAELEAQLIAANSRIANLDPYRDLPEHRTGIGALTRVIPVMPLHEAPFTAVTDPGHVTGDSETTLTLPILRPTAA